MKRSLEVRSGDKPAPRLPITLFQKSIQTMTNIEQDRWSRVKGRLRSSVGEDVYTSWFARMDLESVQQESVHLSVPTRFLKSWIQAHYAERVLACWRAELASIRRIDLNVRSAVIRTLSTKAKPDRAAESEPKETAPERPDPRFMLAPTVGAHEALGGSPLDPRLSFE